MATELTIHPAVPADIAEACRKAYADETRRKSFKGMEYILAEWPDVTDIEQGYVHGAINMIRHDEAIKSEIAQAAKNADAA